MRGSNCAVTTRNRWRRSFGPSASRMSTSRGTLPQRGLRIIRERRDGLPPESVVSNPAARALHCAPGRDTRPPASSTTINSTASDGVPVLSICSLSASIAANASAMLACLVIGPLANADAPRLHDAKHPVHRRTSIAVAGRTGCHHHPGSLGTGPYRTSLSNWKPHGHASVPKDPEATIPFLTATVIRERSRVVKCPTA